MSEYDDKNLSVVIDNSTRYGVSYLIENHTSIFEYEKINIMFEMSLSSYVKWNDNPKNSIVSKSDCLVDDVTIQYNSK
jgi:hypothetical protein